MQTLVLGHNLPTALRTASDLDLKLSIKKSSLEISKNRTNAAPLINWSEASTGVTVNAGITVYEASWTDGGILLALPITGGTLYAHYRAWIDDFTETVGTISDITLAKGTLGAIHPDNPLGFGVWCALRGARGQPIKFSAVANPDILADWNDALDLAAYRDDVYKLVPLTTDPEVHSAYAAHIADQSSGKGGTYRSGYFALAAQESLAILDASKTDDEEVALAKIGDDPDVAGTQYSYLEVTSDNADLIKAGVRADDVVHFLFTSDGFGGSAWTEFVIEEVINERTVRLTTGHGSAVPTGQKVEFWRVPTTDELVNQLSTASGIFDSSAVSCFWPDKVVLDGFTVPGYFACAYLAGLRSATAPHRSLRDVHLSAITSASRTVDLFSAKQLRKLAENRVSVITETTDGRCYLHAAVTSGDPLVVTNREEAVRTTLDAVRLFVFARMRPFLSKNNVYPRALDNATTQLQAVLESLRSTGFTNDLGPLLVEGSFDPPRFHTIFKDQLVLRLQLDLPFPFAKDIDLAVIITA